MTNAEAHAAIMAVMKQAQLAHTSYPIVIESANNGVIDYAAQVNPFLRTEIRLLAAEQLTLGDRPIVRQWGQIWITAVVKAGQGTLSAKSLLDFMRPYYENRQIGPIVCKTMGSSTGKDVKGLWHEPAIVNFYYDTINQ